MPLAEDQAKESEAEAPAPFRSHLLAWPLVAALHLLLVLFLIVGLWLPRQAVPSNPPVQVTLEEAHRRPPPPPPRMPLVTPQRPDAAAPQIEIALAPPAIAAIPHSVMPVAPGGAGNGTGGGGTSGTGGSLQVARPVLPLDPDCETLDAYTARVRTAINRYFEYSDQAKQQQIQGEVVMHFLSDPQGHILQSAVTASRIERLDPGVRHDGHRVRLGIAFTRTGPERWNWQAVMHDDGGPDTPLGSGTVSADNDEGLVHVPGRSDDVLTLELPESLHADVPRLMPHLGHAPDMFLLEKSVRRTLDRAQPLPKIPQCLKQASFNAMMPFDFTLKTLR